MYCFMLLQVEFVVKEKGKVLIPMIFNEKQNKVTTCPPKNVAYSSVKKKKTLSQQN